MKNRHLLFSFLFCIIACQNNSSLDKQDKDVFPFEYELSFRPNILWLVAEDLSPVIPSFGDSTIQTPNLSRLAAEGVCYDNVYSPSPVCAPSRAALATGMYPTHIGANHMRTGPWFATDMPQQFLDNYKAKPSTLQHYEALPPAGIRMFSEYLREAGYYCTNNSKQDYQFRCSVTAWDETSNEAHWKNRQPDQPFFAIFNYGITHESQIWGKATDSLWVDSALEVPIPPYLPNTEVAKKDIRRMYSNIKVMDNQIGQMLKELEAAGELERTIIVWYTDHGGPLPRQKRLLYDSGLKVPMIIRFPNKLFAGQRDNRLISFIDFGPTALSMADIQPPSFLDGKAFLGKYRRKEEPTHIFAAADRFDETYDSNRAVRDERYKYIKYYEPQKPMFLEVAYRNQMPIMQELLKLKEAGALTKEQAFWFRSTKPEEELFDTKADPYEVNNLANEAAYQDKLKELRSKCSAWVTSFEDTGLISEQTLQEKMRPGGKELKVNRPTFKLEQGKVTLSCSTNAATIGYKMNDNSTNADGWKLYKEPLLLQTGDTLKVVADRIGYRYSEIVEITSDNETED